jgi:endonuclease/exonuclease/phosphatase family metal-dependent hydrolase
MLPPGAPLLALALLAFSSVAQADGNQPPRFKALTYNVWGLSAPFAKDLTARITGFCRYLKTQPPEERWDVVLLQEVWAPWIAETLKDCGYAHSLRLDHGKRETGLMILSPHPLTEPHRDVFQTQPGGWDGFRKGESLVTKGVLSGIVRHPLLGAVFVANTHVAANYGPGVRFEQERRAQLIEFSRIVQERGQGLPKVIGGDFNVSPNGTGYTLLWEALLWILPDFEAFEPDLPVSTHSDQNPYNSEDEGKLDHLYSRDGLVPESGRIVFDREGEVFSDHFGWETHFKPGKDFYL